MQKHVESEFTRQARQMAMAPAFNAESVIGRFRKAIGSAPSDLVLDLACGPGIDGTPEMIRLARKRFDTAGLKNGVFSVAAAEQLPFEHDGFDQVMTRLSLHHFVDVPRVLQGVRRVLRRGGRLVLADVVSSNDVEESELHNALERLRDPTHVRMLRAHELPGLIAKSGFEIVQEESWVQERSFSEWAAIIADAARTDPLERVMRALARAGQAAGISLREVDGQLLFTHTWSMLVAGAI